MPMATVPDTQGLKPEAPSASAPMQPESARLPVTGSSSQPGLPQQRIRNTSNTHHIRNAPVAPGVIATIDLSQLHVESDSSDSDFRAQPHQGSGSGSGSGHSRSMSNPFPSFFSPKKKKRAHDGPMLGPIDSASQSNGPQLPNHPRGDLRRGHGILEPSIVRADRRPSFSTGPCITCGSLMRWVRGAEAFRCGICLTVNDPFPPAKPISTRDTVPNLQTTPPGPITIEHSRAIVTECIRSHLEAVLQDVDTNAMNQQTGVTAEIEASIREEPRTRPTMQRHKTQTSLAQGQGNFLEPTLCSPLLLMSTANPTGYLNSKPAEGRRSLPNWQTSLDAQALASGFTSKSRVYVPQTAMGISRTVPDPVKPSREQLPMPRPEQMPHKKQQGEEGREAKRIFLLLEDYIVSHIVSVDNLDSSFIPTTQNHSPSNSQKESLRPADGPELSETSQPWYESQGKPREDFFRASDETRSRPNGAFHRLSDSEGRTKPSTSTSRITTSRSIHIDWPAVDEWYSVILNAGAPWESIYNELVDQGKFPPQPSFMLREVESHILKGQQHAQRVLLKSIETVLKRPGRRIGDFGDFRFLIIALANPLLHASCKFYHGSFQHIGPSHNESLSHHSRGTGPASGQHSVIIKRILGLISNTSDEWHSRIIACFARFSETRFLMIKDLVSGFLAYRLVRYNDKKDESKRTEVSESLVPKVLEGASAATFHAALNQGPEATRKLKKPTGKKFLHGDDWQIKAAVRFLRLLFSANNSIEASWNSSQATNSLAEANRFGRARLRGQIVPNSDFYITLLDSCDLVSDFEGWEQQTSKFSFCQYPFLLSVWAKIQILEHEARRQMKNKARDAFFDSIMTRRNFDQHFILNVRRECLVEDSLKGVSAAIGSGSDDIKKGLRIIFNGEEGIDAGGLRKEWFLLLVREVFNPDHGMFAYDEESKYCYFNPASFETSDQFFLVGVVLGLAIYNSTILDVALPPFAFRKLLYAAPASTTGGLATQSRPSMSYTLADLAEYRPHLASGLQHLLDYDGDVETTFCLEFCIAVEKFGHISTIPLCTGGEHRPVTNANREEYVDLYVRYLLDTAVSRQFEPFKRGFFTVCGCNALGLFRPEEIELLVRGSDEPLDVLSLRLAASYENWPTADPLETEPTVKWFWEIFQEASPKDQRKLLIFITGSDRIPATGPASLSIRILYLGNDIGRFPTARTCFNILTLYRYNSKQTMYAKLWGAVNGSEGFGLK